MTVKQYHLYKEGKRMIKAPYIKKFWDTQPTDMQEEIASKMRLATMYMSLVLGGILGFLAGMMI